MANEKEEIIRNAEKINQLKDHIAQTLKHRDENREEWEKACAEFHRQYDALAFPGGLKGAYERIVDGDPRAMEAAICFLECRPYFFRSGYMFKDILRKAKRAPLNKKQKKRLEYVIDAYHNYKKSKDSSS